MKLEELMSLLEETDFTRESGFAVVLPLLERDGEMHILFEVRSPGISQGGEVCFPGGRI